jgi:hypothetical protein
MPKKRKKKRKKSSQSQAVALPPSSSSQARKRPKADKSQPLKRSEKKTPINYLKQRQEAYAESMTEAEQELGIRATLGWKMLLFLPLVAGSILAKSSIQIELTPFYLLFACMILSSGIALHKRVSSAWSIPAALVYLALVMTILVFYKSFNMEAAVVIVPTICALMAYVELKNIKVPSDLLTVSIALILLLITTVCTGFYAQSGKLYWTVVISGLVPALMGIGALIIDSKEVLINSGWRVSREKTKKGETKKVPAGISFIASTFLLLPPLLLLIGIPTGKVPATFIGLILPFYFLPGIMQSFLEQKESDRSLAVRSTHQAILVSVLLVAGFLFLNA